MPRPHAPIVALSTPQLRACAVTYHRDGVCNSIPWLLRSVFQLVRPGWIFACMDTCFKSSALQWTDSTSPSNACIASRHNKRARDLANHLMNNHSRLWRLAQHLTLMLVDIVFSRHGCMCNPQINQLRQNHVCLPLRQIAMMYYRLDSIPFMPIMLTDQVINQLLHTSIPREIRFSITKLLADRAFSDLWMNPEVTKILREVCLQCGHEHHVGLMCHHLHEAHLCGHRFVEFYMDTLVPAIVKKLSSDFQCDLCQQIFNLPLDTTTSASADQRATLFI